MFLKKVVVSVKAMVSTKVINSRSPKTIALVLVASLMGVFASEIFAQESVQKNGADIKGVHEILDPSSQMDDLGISVPIPISHPSRRYPATDNFPTGPAVGDRLLDISLANQHGEMIDVHQREGDANAVVVFFRSVMW